MLVGKVPRVEGGYERMGRSIGRIEIHDVEATKNNFKVFKKKLK